MQNKNYIDDTVNDLYKHFTTVSFQTAVVSLTLFLLIIHLFFFQ